MKKNLSKEQYFGLRIRKLRKEKGLSQSQLANILGYRHNASISGIEAGKTPLSIENLVKIAETFNVDLHWLITGDDPFRKALEALTAADIESIRKMYAEQYDRIWRDVLDQEARKQQGHPLTDEETADLKRLNDKKRRLSDLLIMLNNFTEVKFRLEAILDKMKQLSSIDANK